MSARLEGALARGTARVMSSRFAKPIARVALVAMGLALLAVIGRASSAGAFGGSTAAALIPADASPDLGVVVAAPAAPSAPPSAQAALPHGAQGSASAEDPVILNTAAAEDLRRLPGIGQKRADAILALRTRLGRFRAIEDLLKVKGIGRATLKRLRPLVRLEAPAQPSPDAGTSVAKG